MLTRIIILSKAFRYVVKRMTLSHHRSQAVLPASVPMPINSSIPAVDPDGSSSRSRESIHFNAFRPSLSALRLKEARFRYPQNAGMEWERGSGAALQASAVKMSRFEMQQPFHDLIVNAGAKCSDPDVRPRGMHPVGQEHHGDMPIEVQPEGRPGEAQMAYAVGRKMPPAAGSPEGGCVEPQGPI